MKEEIYEERVVLCKDKKQLICDVSRMVHCSNVELREKGTCVFCYDAEKIWVAGWGEAISSDVLFIVRTVDKKMNLCSRSNIGRQVTLFFSSDDRVQYPVSLMRIPFVKVIYTKSEREEKEKRLKEEAKRLRQKPPKTPQTRSLMPQDIYDGLPSEQRDTIIKTVYNHIKRRGGSAPFVELGNPVILSLDLTNIPKKGLPKLLDNGFIRFLRNGTIYFVIPNFTVEENKQKYNALYKLLQ